MRSPCSLRISGNKHLVTEHNIPDGWIPQQFCFEILKTCINCSPTDTICPQSKQLGYLITKTWDLHPLNIKFRTLPSDCTLLVFRSFGIPAVNLVCLTLRLVMFIHSSYEHYQDDGYLQCNSPAWRNYKIYLYIGFLNISLSENWRFNVQYCNKYCTSSFIMRLMAFKSYLIPHCFRQMQSHSWNNECVYARDRTVLCCEKSIKYSNEQTVFICDTFCKALNHEGKQVSQNVSWNFSSINLYPANVENMVSS